MREETKPIITNYSQDEETTVDHNLKDIQNDQQQPDDKRDPDHKEIIKYIMDLEATKAEYIAMKERERPVTVNLTDAKDIREYYGITPESEVEVILKITTNENTQIL